MNILHRIGMTALAVCMIATIGFAQTTDNGSGSGAYNITPVETRVLGQRTWLRGGPAGLRVIVTNHITGKPLVARINLALMSLTNGKPTGLSQALFSGNTNSVGSLDASFHTPVVDPGSYQLTIDVKSTEGDDSVTQPIEIQESTQ